MNKEEIVSMLWKHAKYAVNSLSRDLIFETLGELKMAVNIEAVEWQDVRNIDRYLIRDTLNNSAILNKLK